MDTHLQELQTRISYQEVEIQALNARVTEQQREIDDLHRQLQEVLGLLRELRPGASEDGDEPPPHY